MLINKPWVFLSSFFLVFLIILHLIDHSFSRFSNIQKINSVREEHLFRSVVTRLIKIEHD